MEENRIWTKSELKELIYLVNGAAIKVHKQLGPGLLESVYHTCLRYELGKREISFQSELQLPIMYDEIELDARLRCDFWVESVLPVEIKSVEHVLPIHHAQLLTYMKLLNAPIGLLINFNVTHLFKYGQQTLVNELYYDVED